MFDEETWFDRAADFLLFDNGVEGLLLTILAGSVGMLCGTVGLVLLFDKFAR